MDVKVKIMEGYLKTGRFLDLAMKLRAFGASSIETVEAVEKVKSGESITEILAEVGLTSKMEIC